MEIIVINNFLYSIRFWVLLCILFLMIESNMFVYFILKSIKPGFPIKILNPITVVELGEPNSRRR